ncbi:MAG: Rrf2 family transcriptional regulator [Gammaproteobacteria bacterium]|nr:Rrf2 family transcriptional regulator [Gammaproteobacteria bacterium]
MKLSSRAHYAIKTVLELSTHVNEPVTLAHLAQAQNISISYLEQIFALLRKCDIVKSARGPGGGYMLNKPLAEISIASIVKAVDKATVKETSMEPEFNHSDSHTLWLRLLELIGGYLDSISLAELHGLYTTPDVTKSNMASEEQEQSFRVA